jgi:hypothetical protein
MESIVQLTLTLSALPLTSLVVVLALSVVALAAFSIHVVYSIAKDRRRP